MVKNMASVALLGAMELVLWETSKETIFMGLVVIFGQMEEAIVESGLTIR